MATKEELSEQLAVTQKLAAAVDQMARSMSRVESSYDSQITAVEKLTKAIEALKGQDLNSLNQTKLDTVQKELKDTEKGATALTGRIKDLGNQMSKKFPTAAAVGVAALSGFMQGIRNVLALGKGVTGFFTSFVEGAASIAASIIAIPFKMFNALVDTAAAAGGGMNEFAQAMENLRKEFGSFTEPTGKAVIEATKNVGDFAATGLSTFRVFGTMAERIEMMTKLMAALGNSFEASKDQIAKMGLAFPAFQKGLGLSDEAMKAMLDRSKTMGDSIEKTFIDVTKQSTELGKAFGISAKVISRDMGKAAMDVKHFGALTVKEIGQAVVYAKKLGVELDKIVGTLDQFETFDSAAESAAKLSQSFGVSVDAFKLMEAQSPAEQIDMLRKSFRDAGVDASQFTRQQAKLLAQTTGLDEATAKQVFSMKNQGVGLDQIKKKSESAEKKTLTQAEAMSKLADSIERMVKSGGGQEGGFWQQFVKGFLGGIQASKEFREIIWNIKRSLQLTYFEGVRLGKAFVQLFPGVKQFLQGIADFFQPAKFKKLVGGVVDIFIQWMKDLQDPNGKASFASLMDKLKEKFFDFFDMQSASGKKMLDGFKTIVKTISKIIAEGIKWMADKMADGIKWIVDLLTGKVDLSAVGAAGKGGLGFLGEVLAPIADALKHAWTVLKDPLWQLVKTLFEKLKDFLMSPEVMNIVKKALPYLAAAIFGPALTRALMGALVSSVGKAAVGALTGGGSKLFSMIAGKSKDVADKAEKVAPAGKATEGLKATEEVGKASEGAIKGSSNWGVQDAVKLGLKLVAIAAALAVGGIMMAHAVVEMKSVLSSGGINKVADAEAPLAVMAAMVIGAVPFMFALKLVGKFSAGNVVKGSLALALGLGLGGTLVSVAFIAMKAILDEGGIKSLKDAEAPLAIMVAMALGGIPLVLSLALASKVGNLGDVLKGGLVIAAAVAIVAIAGGLLAALLSLINPASLVAAGKFMLMMSLVFLAMVPLILASMAIGALATGPQALALAVAAVGMGVIGAAVAEMAGISVGIIKEIAKLPIDKDFQTKIDAFLAVMKAIQAFTDSMVKVMELLMPSITDLLTNTSMTKKVGLAQDFIRELIGKKGQPGGIVGIVELVIDKVKFIEEQGEGFATAAQTFATMLQAISEVMKAMTPPPEFFEVQTSFINVVAPWTGMLASNQTTKYMGAMTSSLQSLIPAIVDGVKTLTSVDIPNIEQAKAVGSLVSAIAQITKALTPDAKTISAMNDSAAQVSYMWGLFKAKGKSDTGAQLKQIMMGQAEAASNIISTITSGPIKAAIDAASGFSKEQLEGVKVISDILNMVTNIINAVGSSLKTTVTAKIDQGKVDATWDAIPSVTSVMEGMAKHMPRLMSAMVKATSAIPADKAFAARLESAKTLFGLFAEIPKLVKDLAAAGGGAKNTKFDSAAEWSLSMMISSLATFFWRIAEAGTGDFGGTPPLQRLANSLTSPSIKALAGAKGQIETLKSLFQMLTEIPRLIVGLVQGAGGGKQFDDAAEWGLSMMLSRVATFFWRIAEAGTGDFGGTPPLQRIASALGNPSVKAVAAAKGSLESMKTVFTLLADLVKIASTDIGTFEKEWDVAVNIGRIATFLNRLLNPTWVWAPFGTALIPAIVNAVKSSTGIKDVLGQKAQLEGLPGVFDQLKKITDAAAAMKTVAKFDEYVAATNVYKVGNFLKLLVDDKTGGLPLISQAAVNMKSYAAAMKVDGIIPALDAVTNMVKAANDLDKALADGNINKIDVKAKLQNVAKAVGLGGKAQVTLTNKMAQINVNLTVEMNAADLEKAMVMRANSFVRQRLDYLADKANAGPAILPGATYSPAPGAPSQLGEEKH